MSQASQSLPTLPTAPNSPPLGMQLVSVTIAGTIGGATNANPVVLATVNPHGLPNGASVTITGVGGNTAANTTAAATVVDQTHFSIAVAGNGTYTSGGTFTTTLWIMRAEQVIADPTTAGNIAGVTAAGALKVDGSGVSQPVQPTQGTFTDRSGTIATGGTAQQIAASNGTRKYLEVGNPTTATTSLWINLGTTAVLSQPSIEIAPGVTRIWEASFVPTDLVSAIAGDAGHPFWAKEA